MLIKGEITLIAEGIFEVVLWFRESDFVHAEQFRGSLEACREWTRSKCSSTTAA